ncbi:MAG: class I SAM-dependent methyltransferase [Candidatus Sulfotelmatobacter sp.]
MCVEVLKSKTEIEQARRELRRRGLSFTKPWWKHLASKIGISNAVDVGDNVKSWDVLKTVNFIEKNSSQSASILDMGAFASEVPCILHKLHYSNLVGVDLNPKIKQMPHADVVRYEVSDFMHTPFESGSFDAITAISVIEHGFKSRLLLCEISRLLRPGGYFVASFDYWPDKINTEGTSIFGMDWRIFSAQEVSAFLQEAAEYELAPSGEIHLAGVDRPIRCGPKHYTFAWLVLQKKVAKRDGGIG